MLDGGFQIIVLNTMIGVHNHISGKSDFIMDGEVVAVLSSCLSEIDDRQFYHLTMLHDGGIFTTHLFDWSFQILNEA